MLAKAAFPAFILTLGATTLFVLVTISTPITGTFQLLQARYPSGNLALQLGVLGQCSFTQAGVKTCSSPQVGYSIPSNVFGQFVDSRVTNVVLRGLSGSLVLNAVTAGLAGISLFFAVFAWTCSSRVMEILTFLTLLLSSTAGFVTFWLDLAVVLVARARINDYSNGAVRASLGNALWMALAGMVVLIFALCAAGCGSFGRYSDRQYAARNVAPSGAYQEKGYGTTSSRRFWQRSQASRGTY